jgi:hypothetical protein
MAKGRPWSQEEVLAIVDDYFHMLTMELSGQAYNKAKHSRELAGRLEGRSKTAIELKHENISAVLIELGCPYVRGYKPLGNYQSLLFEVVAQRVAGDELFNRAALSAAEQPAVAPLSSDFDGLLVDAPVVVPRYLDQDTRTTRYRRRTEGVHRDYLDREARNRSLGLAGETLVLAYERSRLHALGRSRLVVRVEHVAKTRGDGLGFDILSFEEDGRERFIEVKTTGFGKQTPFFLSRNELEFSKAFAAQFHLCRVFEFRSAPRMFELQGAVDARCYLDPVTYLARFT